MKKLYQYIAIALIIFIVDRVTKLAALVCLHNTKYIINSFLSFELVFNRGVSWGMFHSTSNAMFIAVSLIIAAVTAALCWHTYYNYVRGKTIIAEVCIIAGSVSNLLDRVLYSGVIDFIVLSYGDWSWPVFNIADAVIVLGVGMLVFSYDK